MMVPVPCDNQKETEFSSFGGGVGRGLGRGFYLLLLIEHSPLAVVEL